MAENEAHPATLVVFTLAFFVAAFGVWITMCEGNGPALPSARCFELATERCEPAPRDARGLCIVVERDVCEQQGPWPYLDGAKQRKLGERP